MKVRFIRDSLDGIGLDRHDLEHFRYIYGGFDPVRGGPTGLGRNVIKIGYEATVYAMAIRGPVTQYFIREPRHGSITHFAAPAFDVVDNRISSLWHYRRKIVPESGSFFPRPTVEYALFAIQEWIDEPRFHEGVVEEWDREFAIMNAKAAFMDHEFD